MWTPEGIAAIDYPHSFHPELAPAHLTWMLALAGVEPPVRPGAPFSYAELGCGQGLTSNLLAAVHPEGRFEAIDVLPSHMDNATRLAAAAGLGNVRFACETFADFARRGGLDYDFIVLHGVWSWVDADQRALLAEIARTRLKPGGVLYVSYNTLPGWAADMPVRQLLLEAVEAAQGPLPDRIAAALEELERLASAGGYFDRVPAAARHLRALLDKGDGYLAHEYLNRSWAPFYHRDVAAALAPLSYVGSATPKDWVPPERHLRALIDAAPPSRRETVRDTLLDTRFRRDLFVKEPRPLAGFPPLRFALTEPPGGFVDAARALEEGATALPPEADVAERCARFNAAVLEANRTAPAIRQLASPVLRTGLVVDLLDRLFLLAEQDGADPVVFAWSILKARGKRLRRDGMWLEGEDNRVELQRIHAETRERREWLRERT